MIDLLDIRYVRLGTRDLTGATRFAGGTLGLEPVRETAHLRSFRSDQRNYTLVYFDGAPNDHTVGFEVRSCADLDAATAMLTGIGILVHRGTSLECHERDLERFIAFSDPTGNRIELVVVADGQDARPYRATRDAGITGFSHVGLRTTDARRDEAFWCRVLGARLSDRIGEAALLRIDPVHHKVALFPSSHAGIQHVNHQVATFDDVMRSWYFLRERGVRIVFGPGRHPTSGATFLYFEGPDGMIFEYSSGARMIAPDEEATYQPRQLPHCNASFCMWGSVPELAEFESAGF
jgi:2,3-dihydroxy-p-cumate/2,3-dihydroxybenzoate 3,4-dioxygenase